MIPGLGRSDVVIIYPVCMSVCLSVRPSVCLSVCVFLSVSFCLSFRLYVRMHACMYVYIYIYYNYILSTNQPCYFLCFILMKWTWTGMAHMTGELSPATYLAPHSPQKPYLSPTTYHGRYHGHLRPSTISTSFVFKDSSSYEKHVENLFEKRWKNTVGFSTSLKSQIHS